MRKTGLRVRRYSQIEKTDVFCRVTGWILEGSYCVCRGLETPWATLWEVVDAKSGIIILCEDSLKGAKSSFERGGKTKFEAWANDHAEEYAKLCNQIRKLNENELKDKIKQYVYK